MRKMQEKLIEKAKKKNMDERAVQYLHTDYTIAKLEKIYDFFIEHKDAQQNPEKAEVCLDFIEKSNYEIKNKYKENSKYFFIGCGMFRCVSCDEILSICEKYESGVYSIEDVTAIAILLIPYPEPVNLETAEYILSERKKIEYECGCKKGFFSMFGMYDCLRLFYKEDVFLKLPSADKIWLDRTFAKNGQLYNILDKPDSQESVFIMNYFIYNEDIIKIKKYVRDFYIKYRLMKQFPVLYESYPDYIQGYYKEFFETEKTEQIKRFFNEMKDTDFIIAGGNPYTVYVNAFITGVKIQISEYNAYCIRKSYEKIHKYNPSKSYTFLFFYDGNVMFGQGKQKLRPATLNDLTPVCIKDSNPMKAVIDGFIKNGYMVWKDIIPYIGQKLPPIKISSMMECRTKKEMMERSYKNTEFYPWNRKDLYWGYIAMKAIPYVKEKDKTILVNHILTCMYTKWLSSMNKKWKDAVIYMLTFVIAERTGLNPHPEDKMWDFTDNETHIFEYIRIAIMEKQKISLQFRSINRVIQEHNRIWDTTKKTHNCKVRIPKNSVFLPLRKMLPKEMEWIKTSKRLEYEGEIMHNCVASYDKEISSDQCAIYSYVWEEDNKRYTIEFVKNKNKYSIKQIYGACNSVCPRELKNYIHSFLQ